LVVEKETAFLVVPTAADKMAQPRRLVSVVKLNVLPPTPAGTLTVEGTWNEELVEARLITVGTETTLPSDTVQLPEPAGISTSGEHVRVESTPGKASVTAAVLEPVPEVAVTVADCGPANAPVTAENVAEVKFCGTVKDAGTLRAALLLTIEITAPPAGAARSIATVQTAEEFWSRQVGKHCREDMAGGAIREIPTDFDEPFSDAVTVAV
jgi:hypothetical protein